MKLFFIIKFFILILIFSNTSSYAEDNSFVNLINLENKINNINKIIENKIDNISKAIESSENVAEIQSEIETLSALINVNMNRLNIQRNIQKEIDILSSELSDDLNQLRIKKNVGICKRYNFTEGSESYRQCLLNLIKSIVYVKFD